MPKGKVEVIRTARAEARATKVVRQEAAMLRAPEQEASVTKTVTQATVVAFDP
jgi:hypothetical protein